jgi:hypothetical protein
VSDPADASAWLRAAGKLDDAALVDDAARSFATQTDASYYDDAARQLGPAYLRASTPEAQSGFGGTSAEWRAARQPIADAITRDGTFLDVGCANGLLMESVRAWCGERSVRVEPYGVDFVADLVDLARERLPQWRDRMWVGNAVDWVHPDGMRFDAVRIDLGAVPASKRRELVAHHLERVVASGGRLIVCHYVATGAVHVVPVADALAALGFPGAIALAADVAWL